MKTSLSVRGSAARRLGDLKADEATAQLIELLKGDPNAYVRADAAAALGDIGDPVAIQPVADLLQDPHWHVRCWAALSSAKLGNQTVVPALIDMLEDDDVHVRRCAAMALGDLGDVSAVPPLEVAAQRDPNLFWRLRIARYRRRIRRVGKATRAL